MRLLVLASVLLATASLAFADALVIKNRRPSKILAILDPAPNKSDRLELLDSEHCSLLPKGIVLQANDQKSEIAISGPSEAIAKTKEFLSTFDVRPKQVKITAKLTSKLDKYEAVTTTVTDNGTEWTFKDGTVGIEITIQPRINADGTVTGHVMVDDGNSKLKAVGRKKLGFSRMPDGTLRVAFTREEGFEDRINIDVKFEISD